MLVFDASTRVECQVRRQRSNTPLQALVLLNDQQYLEGCRVLAEQMWSDSDGDVSDASSKIFRLLTSRLPSEREHNLLLEQYREELNYFEENEENGLAYLEIGEQPRRSDLPASNIAALARITNTIMNSTESYFKN